MDKKRQTLPAERVAADILVLFLLILKFIVGNYVVELLVCH